MYVHAAVQPVTACDEYPDITIHNESHSFSSAERRDLGIMICGDHDSELPLNLSLSSDIGTTQCVPRNSSGLPDYIITVSYTHLTLPTIYSV